MNNIDAVIDLSVFFILLSCGFYFFLSVINGRKYEKEYKKQLEKENIAKGFFDTINYIKEVNPKGGFESLVKIRKNLLRDSDTKEMKIIVENIVFSLKEARRRAKLLGIAFLINIINDFIIK